MLPEGIVFKVCWLYFDEDSCPTLDYLLELGSTNPTCFGSVIDKLRKLSDSRYLKPPTSRPLKGRAKGIFEVRVIGGKHAFARLPFILSPQKELIILFGETKKGGDPPPGFIDRAVDYRNKINAKEAKYEEIDFTIFDE